MDRDAKLKELKAHTPTIFAPNCWGGITYNHLDLEFRSPLINMHEPHEEYLKFLANPRYYMDQDLVLKEKYIDHTMTKPFPVVWLGDITLWMNHYDNFRTAREAWERRRERIDWDNLFVMFFDEDPKLVETFLSLPYEKKVCFVPWETDRPGCIPVPYRKQEKLQKYPFWEIVNNLALGAFELYDDVELLHDCKFVKIGNIIKNQ